MKLHVQCDRCKAYKEIPTNPGNIQGYPIIPDDWFQLRAYGASGLNRGPPIGLVDLLLCGDCMGLVAGAIEREVKK